MKLNNTSIPQYWRHSKNTENPLKRTISIIEHPASPVRFLVSDSPTDSTMKFYTSAFLEESVSILIRSCIPTYDVEQLNNCGIDVIDLTFPDGANPSEQIIDKWLEVLKNSSKQSKQVTIAVHCVAGLGRAPLLVAIALIEFGMTNLEAVTFVRDRRKNALNKKQLKFLFEYEPKKLAKSHYRLFFKNIFTRVHFAHK